jgi:hypothetical protein
MMAERDMEEERKDRKERCGGQEKKVNFWNCYFYLGNQESKIPEGK